MNGDRRAVEFSPVPWPMQGANASKVDRVSLPAPWEGWYPRAKRSDTQYKTLESENAMSFPNPACSPGSAPEWQTLADQVLSGQPLLKDQALAVLRAGDEQLARPSCRGFPRPPSVFWQDGSALFPDERQERALSGRLLVLLAVEDLDCRNSPLQPVGARKTARRGARGKRRNSKTYCIVISARGPNEREMQAVCTIVPEIKQQYDLKICVCLGLLNAEQAKQLKVGGVDRVNHNINTGPEYYDQICTTHTYQDRIDTLRAVRAAGLELCSGGIVGMGERDEDLVQMAMELRELAVESIPINFLHPVSGTPLEHHNRLNPRTV